MKKNLEKIGEILNEHLGREELLEWWVRAINDEMKGHFKVDKKRLPQLFRGLNRRFEIVKRTVCFEQSSFRAILYEIKRRKEK